MTGIPATTSACLLRYCPLARALAGIVAAAVISPDPISSRNIENISLCSSAKFNIKPATDFADCTDLNPCNPWLTQPFQAVRELCRLVLIICQTAAVLLHDFFRSAVHKARVRQFAFQTIDFPLGLFHLLFQPGALSLDVNQARKRNFQCQAAGDSVRRQLIS